MTQQIPWLRVFVEGVVIVGSILLALALDAWWQERQDRAQEAEYLIRLVDDLRADTAELAQVVRGWTASQESAGFVHAVLREGRPPDVEPEAILAHVVLATLDRPPYMESATYEELRSSGRLRLIQDVELRGAIVRYHRTLDSGATFIGGMDPTYDRHVLSRVDPEFQTLVVELCLAENGAFNPCSPSVRGFDASSTLDSMIRDPEFLRLVNLRASELGMARRLLERRLSAGTEALRTFEEAFDDVGATGR